MSMKPQGGQDDQDAEILKLSIIGLVLVLIVFALARAYEAHFSALAGAVAWLHVLPFAELVRHVPAVLDIPLLGRWLFLPAAQTHDFLLDGGFARMGAENRWRVLDYSGRAALVLYGPFLVWVLIRGLEFRPDAKFRYPHTLESMIHLQTEDWVTARTARHFNPAKQQDICTRSISTAVAGRAEASERSAMPGLALPRGLVALAPDSWSRALRPEEWLLAKGLVFDGDAFRQLSDECRMSRDAEFAFRHRWPDLDLESISEVLAQQLRQPWTGPDALRPCHRALLAVMALFHDYDIRSGNDLLSAIAVAGDRIRFRRGGMDAAIRQDTALSAWVDRVIAGKPGARILQHASRHAWVETAFPTFLTVARKDRGVLPPAAFLWLKAEDRLMWYILNNVGNEAIMIEAAGAVAHWRAECQIGKPVHRPAVFQAARALMEDYLDLRPDRIALRRQRSDRMRTPGEQFDLGLQAALAAGGQAESGRRI